MMAINIIHYSFPTSFQTSNNIVFVAAVLAGVRANALFYAYTIKKQNLDLVYDLNQPYFVAIFLYMLEAMHFVPLMSIICLWTSPIEAPGKRIIQDMISETVRFIQDA